MMIAPAPNQSNNNNVRPGKSQQAVAPAELTQEQLAAALLGAALPAGVASSVQQGPISPAHAHKQPAVRTPSQPADTAGPRSHTPPAPEAATKQRPKAGQAAPPISPEMQQRVREAKAANFKSVMPAAVLQLGATQVLPADKDTGVYQAYFDRLMQEAGDITDPVERMLIEATAIAFHRGGQLLVKSTQAEHLQASAIFTNATTKMLAEFRRLALSLEAYRASSSARRRAEGTAAAGAKDNSPRLRCV